LPACSWRIGPHALDDLVVLLEIPPVPEEGDVAAVLLQPVDAVAHAGWVAQPEHDPRPRLAAAMPASVGEVDRVRETLP
jgi:hypothetical protein